MNNELRLGLILGVCSGFLWFYAIPYHIRGFEQSLFPRCLTIAMIIPCILLLVQGIQNYKPKGKKESVSLVCSDSIKSLAIVPVVLVYIFLIEITGFYVTTGVFVAVFLFLFGVRKWMPTGIFAITVPLIVYIVIRKILSFPFPEGLFF